MNPARTFALRSFNFIKCKTDCNEKGKPGSGCYEYIDLEKAGGLTMELLWNYRE